MLKYIMFFGLVGCGAAELKTNGLDTAQAVVEEEIPEQFGIINTDNCDQKTVGSTVCNMIFYICWKDIECSPSFFSRYRVIPYHINIPLIRNYFTYLYGILRQI